MDTIKSAIRTVQADVVFLQEVHGEHRRHHRNITEWKPIQFEYLAEEIWPHVAYGKNAVYDDGHHGNAILSRFPILRSENLEFIQDPRARREKRGILHSSLELAFDSRTWRLECFCTHLDTGWFGRKTQLEQICGLLSRNIGSDQPVIVAGDFNDWNQSACSLLEKRVQLVDAAKYSKGKVLPTFPSFFPILPLDRIYTRGFKITNVDVLRGGPWRKLSDHLPVFAELLLEDEEIAT